MNIIFLKEHPSHPHTPHTHPRNHHRSLVSRELWVCAFEVFLVRVGDGSIGFLGYEGYGIQPKKRVELYYMFK